MQKYGTRKVCEHISGKLNVAEKELESKNGELEEKGCTVYEMRVRRLLRKYSPLSG